VTVTLCYICVTGGKRTDDFASRFVSSYHEHPPGFPHDTHVICNGGILPAAKRLLFASMPAVFWARDNDQGWDVSAFIEAAHGACAQYDAMLCLGESAYFHRAGWLERFVDAWKTLGPGLYGAFSSNAVRAHLNTNAFFCAPGMLRLYPRPVRSKSERYEFEHGQRAFWRYLEPKGYPVRLVTWDGLWKPRQWRQPANILWRGDQSNCLLWCNHTDNWATTRIHNRWKWSQHADQPFK